MRDPLPVPARAVRTGTSVERSRFIATLEPVRDVDGVDAVLARVRKEFPDARHHCTASVLGGDGTQQRSNDDGEPAGTAGAPMLAALNGAGVTGVIAVVTRYFGGVLLGTGGLARAYGSAVSGALAEAGVLRRRWVDLVEVRASLADGGRLEADLRHGFDVEDVVWSGEGWSATLALAPDGTGALAAHLAAGGFATELGAPRRAVRTAGNAT
ncbi:IMPACT family protein [Kineococcus sp. GCM10028916]|uniref:IMPACT family protein n=1 Tax=Kineococcus sp. GCM10028916 TaxID=3273394 RepID=UPI0036312990